MSEKKAIELFLSRYDKPIYLQVEKFRTIIKKQIPGIMEVLDESAKIIGYGFGPKYSDTLCVIIPSKKGVKLGFILNLRGFKEQSSAKAT